MNVLLTSPNAQNPFDSFQSALHDLERECTMASMKKKQADSNLSHLKQNLQRIHDDIAELNRKIRESHAKCSAELQAFNNCLFDMSNILTNGEYVATQHVELAPEAEQLSQLMFKRDNHTLLMEIAASIRDGLGCINKQRENLSMEHTFEQQQKQIKEHMARAHSDQETLRMRQKECSILQNARDELNEELQKLSAQFKQLQSSDGLTTEKLDTVKKEYQGAQKELQSLEKILQHKESECHNLSQHTQQIMNELCAQLESWRESQVKHHSNLLHSLEEARKKHSNLEHQVQSEQNRVQQIINERDALHQNLNDALRKEHQISTHKRNLLHNTQTLREKLQDTDQRVQERVDEDKKMQLNIEQLKQHIEKLSAQVEDLRATEEKQQTEKHSIEEEHSNLERSKEHIEEQLQHATEEEQLMVASVKDFRDKVAKLEHELAEERESLVNNDTELKRLLENVAQEEMRQLQDIANMDLMQEMRQQLTEKEAELKTAADEEIENLRKEHAALFEETEDSLNDEFQHYELEARQEEEHLQKKVDLMKQQMQRKQKKGLKRKTHSSQESILSSSRKEKRARMEKKNPKEDSTNDFSVFDF